MPTVMSMTIRRALPDDAPALARLHVDSWRAAYRGLVPDSRLDGLDYDRRTVRFREQLEAAPDQTYLIEQAGQLLGFLTLGGCRDPDVDPQITGEIRISPSANP
jgi:hypothetical protein